MKIGPYFSAMLPKAIWAGCDLPNWWRWPTKGQAPPASGRTDLCLVAVLWTLLDIHIRKNMNMKMVNMLAIEFVKNGQEKSMVDVSGEWQLMWENIYSPNLVRRWFLQDTWQASWKINLGCHFTSYVPNDFLLSSLDVILLCKSGLILVFYHKSKNRNIDGKGSSH